MKAFGNLWQHIFHPSAASLAIAPKSSAHVNSRPSVASFMT
jgi:hypothetical protein